MNNNNNNNDELRGSTTPFNASYEQQKAAARANQFSKSAMTDIGAKALKTAMPGPTGQMAAAGLKAAGKMSGGMPPKNDGEGASEGEGGNQPNQPNRPNPLPGAPAGAPKGADAAASLIEKKKKLKIIAICAGIGAGLLMLVVVMSFIIGSLAGINEKIADAQEFYNKMTNLLSFNGFVTDKGAVEIKIKEAKDAYSYIDDGLLYATLNNTAIFGADIFEDNQDTKNDSGEFDSVDNFEVVQANSGTFYRMKKDMLGDTTTPGKMIYSLMGNELLHTCITFPETMTAADKNAKIAELKENNKGAISRYASTKFAKKVRFFAGHTVNLAGNVVKLVGTVFDSVYYAFDVSQGYNSLNLKVKQAWESVTQLGAYDENVSEEISAKLKAGDECIATGGYPEYVSQPANDYSLYYDAMAYYYVPTIYNKIWNDLDEKTQESLIKETWSDIVMLRNQYYASKGEENYLSYYFEPDGELYTNLDGGYAYISNISVSADAAVALEWKQGRGQPWSSYVIGVNSKTGKNETIGSIGCLVTSVAKLIKLSGTQINSTVFDPGEFAKGIKAGNGFNSGGGLIYSLKGAQKSWYNLVPNFYYKARYDTAISASSSNLSALVSNIMNSAIQSSGIDASKCYFTVQISSTRMPTHFMAVVGSDEQGLIVSDPAIYSVDTYHLNDIKKYWNHGDLQIIAVQLYFKTD